MHVFCNNKVYYTFAWSVLIGGLVILASVLWRLWCPVVCNSICTHSVRAPLLPPNCLHRYVRGRSVQVATESGYDSLRLEPVSSVCYSPHLPLNAIFVFLFVAQRFVRPKCIASRPDHLSVLQLVQVNLVAQQRHTTLHRR